MSLTLALIFVIAPIGAFDAIYYHVLKFKLARRPESRQETWTHIARSLIMAVGITLLAFFKLHGAWFWVLGGLLIFDFLNNLADVFLEHDSRKSLGGLPRPEYIIHVVGATGMGAVTMSFFAEAWSTQLLPTEFLFAPHGVGVFFQLNALLIGLGAAGLALLEAVLLFVPAEKKICCVG